MITNLLVEQGRQQGRYKGAIQAKPETLMDLMQRLTTLCVSLLLLIPIANAQMRFIDVTQEAGLAHVTKALKNLNSYGYGAAFIDYNRDGYLDLYVAVTESNGRNVLYQNNGDGTFRDVTASARINSDGHGVTVADYDNDGYDDIYLTVWDGPNVLYHNNKDGTFTDVTAVAGVGSDRHSTGAAFGDYNNDGFLDVYVGNYYREPNQLYRNNGDGTFTDVSDEAGVADRGSTLALAFFDADNDGDLDLFVGNDLGDGCGFYRNEGNGTFSNQSAFAGIREPFNTMGVAIGDYNNDGFLDIDATDVSANVLYRNNGDGTFTNVARQIGLGNLKEVAWGTVFADFDNDGFLDLFLVNGNMPSMGIPNTKFVPMRHNLFRNNGNGGFVEVTEAANVADRAESRGVIVGDYNNDGYPDLYVTGNDTVGMLYRNTRTNHHWMQLSTQGTVSNRDGIGARITVFHAGSIQVREIGSGSSYLSCNEKSVIIGLGAVNRVEKIEVKWPSGILDSMRDVPADQHFLAIEGAGFLPMGATPVSPENALLTNWGRLKSIDPVHLGVNLQQNYPNPFNPETWIPYQLYAESEVSITIYDIQGRMVRKLNLGVKPAGDYLTPHQAAYWDGRDSSGAKVGSGVYFYKLEAGQFSAVRRMVVLE